MAERGRAMRLLRQFAATLLATAPRSVVSSAGLMLVMSLTEGVGLLMLVPLLQLVGIAGDSAPTAGPLSFVFASLGIRPTLGIVLAVYVAIAVCQSYVQRAYAMVSATLQQQTQAALRMRLYTAIANAQWLFIARSRASDLTHVLTTELDRIGIAAHDLVDLAVSLLMVVVYVGIALRLSASATLLVLLCGGSLAWMLRRRVGDAHRVGADLGLAYARVNRAAVEHLASMKTATSYGALPRQREMFQTMSDDLRDVNVRVAAGFARLRQQSVVGSAAVLAVIVLVAREFLTVPPAPLLALLFLFARLVPRLTGLVERAQSLATGLPALAVFMETEARCVAAAVAPVTAARPLPFAREIRFDRVTFRYVDDDVLTDINLVIRPGTMTAVVGPSGAGKSSLADLLLGLIEPTSGSIRVDGQPLDRNHVDAWRARIGYVNQDTFLFHDSIRANLTWAQPGATEEDLGEALRLAAADQFVRELPQGLDTVIGDRGVLLSGGERQRLALARALLRRPHLLILDEATNALDSENERRILAAIDSLRDRMTIVLITHRLSTIRDADVIHLIERGRLVASGPRSHLARSDGRFAQPCDAPTVQTVLLANELTSLSGQIA